MVSDAENEGTELFPNGAVPARVPKDSKMPSWMTPGIGNTTALGVAARGARTRNAPAQVNPEEEEEEEANLEVTDDDFGDFGDEVEDSMVVETSSPGAESSDMSAASGQEMETMDR